jgi:hypothetical protein
MTIRNESVVGRISRWAAYGWASPNSLLGLAAGMMMAILGSRARVVRGVLEFSGGVIGSLLMSRRLACPFRAVTLGHVILATDDVSLERSRVHEHVHVRQYERWGPFFLPAYFASSLWQLFRGGHCYRDNYFEREAFARSPATGP